MRRNRIYCKDGTLSEHAEQVAFMKWAKSWLPVELRPLIFAIPNGGKRNIVTAMKLKAEGVEPGVPDIFFAHARLGYHGLFIEMKKVKGGTTSPIQWGVIAKLNDAKYYACVCRGAKSATDTLRWYMLTH